MLKLLCPDIYISSIYDMDFEYLQKKNIKGILIDLDNTLLSTVIPSIRKFSH